MSSRWVPVFQGAPSEVLVLQSSYEASGIPTFVPDLNLLYLDISARGGNMFFLQLLVPEDRLEDVLRIPLRTEDAHALRGVLLGGGARRVREALVVEVVDESRESPLLDVLPELRRVGAHRGLDGEHVLPQRLARRVP